MPKLHRYAHKEGYYALTQIRGKISTFQLTAEGVDRLLHAGIQDGDRFRRALLFDLWRMGDAFTYGTGPGEIAIKRHEGQLGLDFSNDPELDSIFVGCSLCGGLDSLHLVEVMKKGRATLALFCPVCRRKTHRSIDSSIPLPLITRGLLEDLIRTKANTALDKNVTAFKDLLDRSFIEKWETLFEAKVARRKQHQNDLFDDAGKNRKLI